MLERSPKSHIVSALAGNLFTSPEVLKSSLWQGVLALAADDFFSVVARKYPSPIPEQLNSFYSDFLGQFKEVSIDITDPARWRFRHYDVVGATSDVEGVEFTVTTSKLNDAAIHTVRIFKVTTVFGHVKNIQIG